MQQYLIIIFILGLTSCSSLRRTGVGIFSGGLSDGSAKLMQEKDYEYFKLSTPANLKMMESLLAIDEENEQLLATIIQGFSAYAFGVYETQYLNELYQEIDNGEARERSLAFYSKAVEYGKKYIELKGIDFNKFKQNTIEPSRGVEYLKKHFDEEDMTALFFMAQAWASMINMDKSNILLVGELTNAKSIFDWACSINPDFQYGACQIFQAGYLSSRPKMLGGDPQKGSEIFKQQIKLRPYNMIILVSYLQYSVIPAIDEDEYHSIAKKIESLQEKIDRQATYAQRLQNKYEAIPAHLNLLNAFAWEKFKIIKKQRKNIF